MFASQLSKQISDCPSDELKRTDSQHNGGKTSREVLPSSFSADDVQIMNQETPANFVRMANGKLRPKRGTGKPSYGRSETQIRKLQEIHQDDKIHEAVCIHSLHQFTEIFIEHARDLARSGQKDSARNWYRYFTNSGIVEVVRLHDAGASSSLRDKLANLCSECHPEEPANWETDIHEIRDALREIITVLTCQSEGAEKRSCHGDSSHRPRFDIGTSLEFHPVQ